MDIKLKEVVNIKNDKYIDKDKDNSVLREEYTGRWTNLNIFTGALELRRMVEITKPDGEVFLLLLFTGALALRRMVEITKPDGVVIHRHNQHHNTTSAIVHI